MLQQYLRVLLTKDNTGSLKLSIDNATNNVKTILKDIEGPGAFRPAPFEVYSPTYQEARKAEYTGGKAGIGPFALNNAHHILTQLTKLHMVSNDFTEAMGITDVSRIFDVPTEHNPRGGRILDWLSAMINAFVDIAKDPYIVRLNVNGWTYNMVSFLLRTGKGRDTFYFMYQPILREMAQEVLKTKGKYGIDRTKTPSQLENEAIERVLDKYDPNKSRRKKYAQINKDLKLAAQTYSELFMEQELNINNTSEYTTLLRQAIKDPMEISDFNDFQVRVYYAWKMLKPYADSLANLVKYSKIDTKKTGKTFAEQLNYYDGMQRLLDDPNFEPGAIRRFYDETFVGHKTDNAILFGSSILSNKLLRNTELFSNQKDAVLSLLGRKGLADPSLLKAIISGMEAQIKSRFFTQYIKDNGIDITKMFKGRTSMAKRLNNFKELIRRRDPRMSHLIDNNGNITNDFLEFLIPNIQNTDDNPDGLDFIDTSELLNVEQAKANNLINYWRELIEDPNPQISKLFKDLAVYAFIIGGDNPVMNGFFQYLPNSYRITMGYRDYMRNALDQYSNNSTLGYADKDDFFRNNWTNDKLVKPVALYTKKGVLETIQYNSTVPNMIAGVRNGEIAINANNWVDIQVTRPNGEVFTESYPIFPPYIKYNDGFGNNPQNWHLYTLVGYGTNEQGRYYPIYGLVGKKGYRHRGHTVTEYGVQTQFDFNKETEWNYTEAVNNPTQLASMSSNPGIWQSVKSITDLASYQNYNYMQQNPQTVLEEDIEDGEAVLEEKEEPDTVIQPNPVQEWSFKEGWSVEYFRDKVLPKLNQAWQLEYKLAADQTAKADFKGSMTFSYGNNARPGLRSKTTLEAIKNGERTSTTRYESDGNISYWQKAQIGDIIEFHDNSGSTVKVEVTQPLTRLSSKFSVQLQQQNTRKTYTGFITELQPNQVFVFGSNTQGRHGKGAALIAKSRFGAIYGQAEGPQGQSYAIITKDLTKSKHPSRTVEQIQEQIAKLYDYARQNPDKEFLVAYSSTGRNLNGYSNQQMADMFSAYDIPNNIVFEDGFSNLLTSIQQNTQQQTNTTEMNFADFQSIEAIDMNELVALGQNRRKQCK